ncbi:oligosaccharide flippase family protein [Paenibacillus sp. FSL H7-0716]|uniref:oligosaccharide flippase family protein n=1 Tax=Paenibacillus TaxID=44249 RepID=UPI002116E640|nr:oligosaccharide flippase family protein [Paenibacillus odorifer]
MNKNVEVRALNTRAKSVMKNLSYTLTSNLVSLAISSLVVLVVPKLIGVEEYGYWQLYMFFTSYVGFLHFGWNDGIYLRYGGDDYRNLDKKLFFSQFLMLTISQISIACLIVVFTLLNIHDSDRNYIIRMTALCLLVVNVRYMFLYILQATNRIKEYAKITMLDRIVYVILIVLFLLLGIRDYKLIIVADISAKFVFLLYAMYCCKEIAFQKLSIFYFNFIEMFENIKVGIKLMFSNIANIMIIGVVRFGIERFWGVSTFGKISLTFSVSNLMMIFINAIGIIMFPLLKRTDERKISNLYLTIRDLLLVVTLGVLILYFPMKSILTLWLPDYADTLMYMCLLFPMCIFEGRTAVLINTYYKAMRKESLLLKINLISLFISILITVITTLILKNLHFAVLSILLLLAFRSLFAEILLCKSLELSIMKDIILELIVVSLFVISGWFFSSLIGGIVYIVVYFTFLIMKRRDIAKSFNKLKQFMST